jgi:hypothetical protein
MKNSLFALILFGFFFTDLAAQVYTTQYRLPGLEWQEIRTDRFRLIYPADYRDEAIRSLSILEAEYSDIKNYIGGELQEFPFILNPENDRSNGFVSPINFRSEVELAPIRGKALNPQSGDWLESVLPHELVHALHFSVNPPALTRMIGLFSPDLRRSVHAAAPLGLHEGTAVEYESHGTIPNSGRGNYPYFTHQFNSLLNTSDQWSMGQLFHTTDYTLPFNRHYVGGYEFIHWLQNSYGDDTANESIQFHYKYPFLGYGIALRSATGKWPSVLYREFSEQSIEAEKDRRDRLSSSTIEQPLELNGTCRRANRPLWVDENTILYFSRFCNKPSGFYTYNIESKESKLIEEIQITEDHIYNFSSDSTKILFSRYHSDARYDNVFRGDLHQFNLGSQRTERLTFGERLFSPVQAENDLLFALQTDAHTQLSVLVDKESGQILKKFSKPENSTIIQVAPNPAEPGKIAIVGKINSVQGVWLQYTGNTENFLSGEPDLVFENGSIMDIHWHKNGDRFLFVSDHSGAMNIYEYHTDRAEVKQITHGISNRFEPSYSPNGNAIAFIKQVRNENLIFTHTLNDPQNYATLDPSSYSMNERISEKFSRPLMNRAFSPDTSSWEFKNYRTGAGWLKPRLWIPGYERESGFDRISVNVESVDQLNRQRYEMELSHYMDRLWYDFEYTYKGFFPGFRVNVYNDPTLTSFRITQNDQEFIVPFLQQSRGASLKIPFRYYLERNARFSSLLVEPQFFINQLRFLNPNSTSRAYSDFGTRHTLGLRTVFNYNVRQFTRDVQPNAGWVFFTESRYGLNRTSLNVQSEEFNVDANLSDRKGFRGYISTFLAPLARYNQSLRLTGQVITQTDLPVFNVSSLYSDNFSDLPLPAVNNAGIFNTRYTIPVIYPDDGGLLLPAYLSNVYLVLFSQTVTDLDRRNVAESSRTVYGAGIRSRFRLSNLRFDIGISIGWEPTRDEFTAYFGSF